ncbi:solute carrier organic anion transporter family member 4A1-like isoform X2 [Branchiostoma floridae]|uniref:Solute carrier organic anion transporter family member n=1 Tax=Branchiostoma floridae TaxID=7739 RepID=A0A9J7LS40_BRAFL|nr:solute carrier organic anion transporter family member 4A1-like isoform X2 [Branchiostoma floridae]
MDNPGFHNTRREENHELGHAIQHDLQENNSTKADVATEKQDDTVYQERFGWGKFRPDYFQFFGTVQGMMVLLVICTVAENMTHGGMIGATISTIEKRYQLPSSKSGLVSTIYDVAHAVAALLLTFIVKTRRGKIQGIAAGTFLLGLGHLLYSLPHFIVGPHNYGEAVRVTCDPASNTTFTACVKEERGLSDFLFVFLFAQCLNALGGLTIYVFGSDILESTAPAGSGGFYLGILNAFKGAAGALGFIVTGQLLRVYIDFDKPGSIPPSDGSEDARWLGAWWLGFPPLAVAVVLTAPWILGLPEKISAKETETIEKGIKSVPEEREEDASKAKGLLGVLDFFKQVWVLCTNPTYMFTVLTGISVNMCITGLNTFGIKYVENQFSMTAGSASIVTGLSIVLAGILGSVMGGVIMKKYKMGVTGSLKLVSIATAFLFALPVAFLVRCPNTNMAGVTIPYGNGSMPRTPIVGVDALESPCNQVCPCPPAYNPVCGENGVEYFSPCLAGCRNVSQEQQYTSCHCHVGNQTRGERFSATSGRCSNGCTLLPLAMFLLAVFAMGIGMDNAPRVVIMLSCVKQNQRSFALGIDTSIRVLLGSVPAPLVYGALVDKACLLWDRNCDKRGACLLYDNALLSTYMAILKTVLASWSVFCACLAMFFWNRRNMEAYEVEKELEGNDEEM